MSQQLQTILDAAWEDRANISIQSAPKEVADAVEHVIAQLDNPPVDQESSVVVVSFKRQPRHEIGRLGFLRQSGH